MKNDQITTADFESYTGDEAIYRARADAARSAVLIAGWRGLTNLFRSAAARIRRINRFTENHQATA